MSGRTVELTTRCARPPAYLLSGVALVALWFLAFSSPALAAYQQTGLWSSGGSNGVAVSQTDGTVYNAQPLNGFDPGRITKWTAAGLAGTPAFFGSGIFSGVAVNPVTGNVYGLSSGTGISTFQPDGTTVGSPIVVDASDNARLGTDAAGNVYFPNQTDDTVEKFSAAGALLQTFGPLAGGPNLNGPLDAAVDAAGNVYVADQSVSTNEVQSVLRGVTGNVATGGTYELSFDGQTTGATGTGDLSAASGTGDVNRATGTGDRASLATGTGNRTSGSNVITNLVTTTGTFAVGESISGTGIPVGATITAVDATSLTLSVAATSTGTAGAIFSGSKTLANVVTSTGTFATGMTITGTGIPAGTTVTAVGANTLTLSQGVTTAGTAGALTAGNITNLSTSAGTFAVGMVISGTGIPAGATILSINGGTLALSAAPSAAGTGVALSAGSTTVSNVVTSTGAFVVGESISGTGIPASATISAVGANSLTLSAAPTVSGTGVALTADIGFNASSTVVDAALEALSTIGAGNVSVSGSGAAARVVTFGGTLAGTNVAEMTCNGANLTYAGAPPSPLCAVTTTTQGFYSAGRVVKYEADGDFASNFFAPPGKFTALAVDVDRTTGEVFIAGGLSNAVADVEITKHNAAGTEIDSFGLGESSNANNSVGLAVNTSTGNVYASRGNGEIRIWSEVAPPTVVTGSATSIGQTTATLNGTVNPNGQAVTDCEFEYGTTTAYGQTAQCVPDAGTIGSGSTPVNVSASISGLSPGTDYHFRLTAANAAAGGSDGNDAPFSTSSIPPPDPTTLPATSVGTTTATLNGQVDLNGQTATDCYFEWGVGSAFNQEVDCASMPSGAGNVPVSANLSSLTPSTGYQYRLVVTTDGGTETANNVSFTTNALAAPTVTTGSASSITQTTATLNGAVNPNSSNVTSCQVQYGTTTAYGSSAPCTPSPGSGSLSVPVSAAVTGLTPGTTYHFRVVATNGGGSTNGNDVTFMTDAETCATNPALCPPPPPPTCETDPSLCPPPPPPPPPASGGSGGDAQKLASCRKTATKAFKKTNKKASALVNKASGKSAKKAARKKAKKLRKRATAKRKRAFKQCQAKFGG